MIERSGELPDDIDELKRLALANAARADQSEADAQAALLDTADFAEGIAASIGKRPPQFAGS